MGIKSAKANKRKDKKQNAHRGPAPIQMKDEFQEYGKITKVCGNCHFMVMLPDSKEYLGVLRRRMFKRAWVTVDQIVLVSRRDFQDSKVDIIHRYNDDDVRNLFQMNELPPIFAPSSSSSIGDDDPTFSDIMYTNSATVVHQPEQPSENDEFLMDIDGI